MLEPCESRGQALLTTLCFVLLGLGILAGAYACFLFAESARVTIPQMNFQDTYARRRSGLVETMVLSYAASAAIALGGLFFCTCGAVVGIRSFFPSGGDEDEL